MLKIFCYFSRQKKKKEARQSREIRRRAVNQRRREQEDKKKKEEEGRHEEIHAAIERAKRYPTVELTQDEVEAMPKQGRFKIEETESGFKFTWSTLPEDSEHLVLMGERVDWENALSSQSGGMAMTGSRHPIKWYRVIIIPPRTEEDPHDDQEQ